MRIQFKNNGNTNVWDEKHEHVVAFEKPWLILVVEYLKAAGVDPVAIEFEMPNGWRAVLMRNRKSPYGYSWELK